MAFALGVRETKGSRMRWLLIILLMCNGIYFVWQGYLIERQVQAKFRVTESTEYIESLELFNDRSIDARAKINSPDLLVRNKEELDICWMIGPFKELISSKQVAGRMASLDIELEVVELTVQGSPDYWVHIAPMPTRKLALKKLRELQSNKVDSYLVTEGELANGISLGFFASKARADAVYEQRKRQGYTPTVRTVPRVHTEIWLVSGLSEGEKISDQLWETMKEGNSGLERRKNYCNTIASSEKLE